MIIENLSGIKHEEKGLSTEIPIIKHAKQFREETFIRMHYHSSFEVNVCESICGIINIEGKTYNLNKVKLIFLPPGTLHSYRIMKSEGNIKVWHLGMNLFPLINSDTLKNLFPVDSYHVSSHSETVKRSEVLLEDIERSQSLRQCGSLLNLLDMYLKDNQKKNDQATNPFLLKIIKWSESNYHRRITLDQGAAAVHLSRYHFARKFKDHTGSTYMEYLSNLRLESSLQCLQEGLSVTETSEKSGFSDVSYFIKRFKQTYGRTPLEYQSSFIFPG